MTGELQNLRGRLQELRVAIGAAETVVATKRMWGCEVLERERQADKESHKLECRSRGEKVKLAEEVFRWCGQFCKTKEYLRLDVLNEREGVKSFCVGHGDSRCCWYLHVLDDGSLRYAPFSGGISQKRERVLNTPKQLASELTLEKIKQVHHSIVTGKVYEYLKWNLRRFLDG